MFYQLFLRVLPMVPLVAAGQHEQDSVADRYPRRHHHRLSLSQRQEPAPECQPGQFQCIGTELQQCVSEAWFTIQHCDGEGLYCAADNASCMWKTDDASGVVAPSSVVPASADGVTAPAASTQEVGAIKAVVPPGTPGAADHGDHAGQWGQGNQGGHGNQGGQGGQGGQGSQWGQGTSVGSETQGVVGDQGTPTGASSSSSNDAASSPTPTGATSEAGDEGGHTSSSSTDSASNHSPTGDVGKSLSWNAPHNVIYANKWDPLPDASTLGDINRFILTFWTDGTTAGIASMWQQMDAGSRKKVLESYHNAGVALMIAIGGETDAPVTNGVDPKQCAKELADWVEKYGVDGVDIDFEDMASIDSGTGEGEAWVVNFHTELRRLLPKEKKISHAPVAPWFTSSDHYKGGAYAGIHKKIGDTVDFYNIQFYNQNENYQSCQTLLFESGSMWPGTSAMEISKSAGVPKDKIVIGKLADKDQGGSGFMDIALLSQCMKQAKENGLNGGIMFWKWIPGVVDTIAQALGSKALGSK